MFGVYVVAGSLRDCAAHELPGRRAQDKTEMGFRNYLLSSYLKAEVGVTTRSCDKRILVQGSARCQCTVCVVKRTVQGPPTDFSSCAGYVSRLNYLGDLMIILRIQADIYTFRQPIVMK